MNEKRGPCHAIACTCPENYLYPMTRHLTLLGQQNMNVGKRCAWTTNSEKRNIDDCWKVSDCDKVGAKMWPDLYHGVCPIFQQWSRNSFGEKFWGQFSFLSTWQGWVYKLHQGYKCQDLSSTEKIQKYTEKHGKNFGGASTFAAR